MDSNIIVDPERPINTIIFSMEMTNPYVFRQIFELYDKSKSLISIFLIDFFVTVVVHLA